MTHFSNTVIGRSGDYAFIFPVPVATNPKVTNKIVTVEDENKRQLTFASYAPNSASIYKYIWDGKDNLGNETWASAKRVLTYKQLTSDNSVENSSFSITVGGLKAKKLGLGGWLPSIWHFYDSSSESLISGNGSTRKVKAVKDGTFYRVASADGSEVYYFDSIGRITFTKTGLTGSIIYKFNYDETSQKLVGISDSFNKLTRITYDSAGNFRQIISAENITTEFTTDENGYLSSAINPNNERFTMIYKNSGGLLSSFTKPNGVLTKFTYDADGNLLSDIGSGGQSTILLKTMDGIKATSSLGRSTLNNYNAESGIEVETSSSGLVTKHLNDQDSSLVSNDINEQYKTFKDDLRFGDQVKSIVSTQVKNFGFVKTNVEDNVDLNDLTNPFSINTLSKTIREGNSELVSHYDGLTRTNTLTTKLGRSIITQLDSFERPILEQSGNNLPKKYFYQDNLLKKIVQGDREVQLSYDPNTNLLTSVKNSDNQEINFYYDQAQRLSAKRLADDRMINFQYDSNNNLVSITPPGRPEHKLNYGTSEQLSSYVPPALQGVNNVSTLYSYSKDKELIKILRPDGEVINFNYGATSGLLDSMTGNFGTISREYKNGLLTKIMDQNNQVARLGYIGSVVSSLAITDSQQKTIYTYQRTPSGSANGRVESEMISAGSRSQNISYFYDADKILTGAGDLGLEYNSPNGQLVKTTLDNVNEYYSYNKMGEVKSYSAKLVTNGKEKLLYGYSLERDNLGRIVKKLENFAEENMEHRHGHRKKKNDVNKLLSEYAYDKAGRLIKVHGFRRNSNYEYDLNSNRIHVHNGDSEFNAVYDHQDRLIKFNQSVFSYNPNGELLSKSELIKSARDNDQKKNMAPSYVNTAFNYDVLGNLKQVGKVSYQIDPLQRRSARLINGIVTNRYIYNTEGQLIGELDDSGELLKTFVYGTKSHVPDYFIDQNNERYKLIVDQLGSVRFVVKSSTGMIIQKMNHDEFGKVLVDTNSGNIPFGFAGGIYDCETKLVRFGVRDYDPETSRWLSKDPIRFNSGDTNLYGYALQDPINLVDPTGLAGNPIPPILNPNPASAVLSIIGAGAATVCGTPAMVGGIAGSVLGNIVFPVNTGPPADEPPRYDPNNYPVPPLPGPYLPVINPNPPVPGQPVFR